MKYLLEKKILIIGYGNTLRSDDGVGQLIAQDLAKMNFQQVECLSQHQLTPELAEKIAQFSAVIFIDGKVNIQEVEKNKIALNQNNKTNNNWTHNLQPQSLISFTNFLYKKTPISWLISIPITNLNLGDTLSLTTQQSKEKALIIIQELISQILNQEQENLCTK